MIKWAASFVLGVWCVQRMPALPTAPSLMVAMLFSVFIFFLFFRNRLTHLSKWYLTSLLMLVVFMVAIIWSSCCAYWRLSDALPSEWERQEILVQGVVSSMPQVNATRERFNFVVERVLTPHAVVPKHVGLNFYTQKFGYKPPTLNSDASRSSVLTQHFHAGERWTLTVKLKRPHGTLNPHGFDFSAWALSENMRAIGNVRKKSGMQKNDDLVWHPSYLIERLRETIKIRIAHTLDHHLYRGVIQALVVGDNSAINVTSWQVLLRTGVTHLMSISGLHITMLSGLAFGLMYAIWRRIPTLVLVLPARKSATLAGVLIACVYAFVAGFSVPTQRTFYMLMVFAIALWSGRQLVIAQVLSIALIVVVLIDPWAVNAAGFWLSFGAVALISFALNGRIGNTHWFKGAVMTQWAVTIGMLPLLLMLFNQASVIAPIANAIAIPVISFVVTPLALLGGFLAIDWPLQIASQCLAWMMAALEWMSTLSIATWHQHAPAPWTFLLAMAGALMLLLPRGVPLRVLGLLGFLPMLFVAPDRPAVGEMKIIVLDVGQGLSVHVQTATHDLLYDAGPKYNNQADAGAKIILPYLYGAGVKQLDALVVSHDDNDHSGGAAAILAMMPTLQVLSTYHYVMPDDRVASSISNKQCHAGLHWEWDTVRFDVLYPTQSHLDDVKLKDNNKSCVIKISSDAGSMLLTGDIQKKAERYLIENVNLSALNSDVMTVPHHGSKTSSTEAFLEAVSPIFSIATAGYLNHFGHPKQLVLDRYQAVNSRVYQSAKDGAVTLIFKRDASGPTITLQTRRSNYQRYWLDSVKFDD